MTTSSSQTVDDMQDGAANREAPTRRPLPVFWFAFFLFVCSVVGKLWYWGLPASVNPKALWAYAVAMAALLHEDLVYAALMGLLGWGLIHLTRRRPVVQRGTWIAWVGWCTLCALYAVATGPVYGALRTPLTYPLIYLAIDVRNVRSSLAAYATPVTVTAVFSAPVLYVLASLLAGRWIRAGRMTKIAGGVLAVGFVFVGTWSCIGGRFREYHDFLLSQSPHRVLLQSCWTELVAGRPLNFTGGFPITYLDDFKSVAERGNNPAPAAPSTRPGPIKNVIVVVLESTATRYLSVYGSPFATTPRLLSEEKNCVIFDNFYAQDVYTDSSLLCLTLSIYPHISWKHTGADAPHVPGTGLAEVLATHGYRSSFITSGDLDWAEQRRFLEGRGFNQVLDNKQLGAGSQIFSWGVEDRYMTDALFRWIDQESPSHARPFYSMLWTIQTHHPYAIGDGQTEQDMLGSRQATTPLLNRYLNCVREADRQIGRIIDGLRQRGLDQETLLIITGDHGEAFADPHPILGHGANIYQECVNVPCILWSPRLYSPGRRDERVGGHIDLNPTITDLLGFQPASDWQGRSLFDPQHSGRAYFFSIHPNYSLGVRDGEWKLIYNASGGKGELFNLRLDPDEHQDVADKNPQIALELRQRVSAWINHERDHWGRLLKSN